MKEYFPENSKTNLRQNKLVKFSLPFSGLKQEARRFEFIGLESQNNELIELNKKLGQQLD